MATTIRLPFKENIEDSGVKWLFQGLRVEAECKSNSKLTT